MQKKYDVIIAGLGTAGAIALIRCARLGLSVLGIERLGQMGGTGTAGGIGSYYYGSKGGLFVEINSLVPEIQKTYFKTNGYTLAGAKAVALERAASDACAEFLYNTHIIDAISEPEPEITCMQEGKRISFSAKILIDTTGNGDIAQLCGCTFRKGSDYDGLAQPYTNSVFIADPAARIQNKDAGYIDMCDNAGYSKELLRANTLPEFLSDHYQPEKIFLQNAPLPGVREGQLLEGMDTVNLSDALKRTRHENTVFFAYSNVDTHEKCIAFEGEPQKDWYVASGLWPVNLSVAISMGCMIPKNKRNLLVGGRALSVTHDLAPLVRMKSDMEKCGETLAYMAHLSVKHSLTPADISYDELKPFLIQSGVLNTANDVGFLNRTKTGMEKFKFPETLKELELDLSGKRGGFGIFGAQNIENAAVYLAKWQNAKDKKGMNCALALGLLKDSRALPTLRTLAKTRNTCLPETGIKMTVPYGVSAVYLLGKLKDREAVPILKDILEDKGSFNPADFVENEMFRAPSDLSFQFCTHAIASLCDIADAHQDLRPDIHSYLKNKIIDNVYPLRLFAKATDGAPMPYDYTSRAVRFVKYRIQ